MTKRALISVSDKAGIAEFCPRTSKLGWDFNSGDLLPLTMLGQISLPSTMTGFPEMMDGREDSSSKHPRRSACLSCDLDSLQRLLRTIIPS